MHNYSIIHLVSYKTRLKYYLLCYSAMKNPMTAALRYVYECTVFERIFHFKNSFRNTFSCWQHSIKRRVWNVRVELSNDSNEGRILNRIKAKINAVTEKHRRIYTALSAFGFRLPNSWSKLSDFNHRNIVAFFRFSLRTYTISGDVYDIWSSVLIFIDVTTAGDWEQ